MIWLDLGNLGGFAPVGAHMTSLVYFPNPHTPALCFEVKDLALCFFVVSPVPLDHAARKPMAS